MVINIIKRTSHKPDKKYDATIDDKKTISFGQRGYSDYTQHKDDERKERYINRQRERNWDKTEIKKIKKQRKRHKQKDMEIM